MTPERKDSLLAYCRIEAEELTPADDALLETMFLDAVGYMTGAGVAEPEKGTPRRAQYDLCVNRLVLDDWDRRGTSDSERSSYTITENKAFRRTLNQLKLTEPAVFDLDTGE